MDLTCNWYMNFVAYLFERNHPDDHVAIVEGRKQITYGQLKNAVHSTMEGLQFSKGERVLILSENNLFFIVSYLAAMGKGLVTVPIFSRLSPKEIAYIYQDVGAVGVFAHPRLRTKVEGIETVLLEPVLEPAEDQPIEFEQVAKDDLAVINYTSGSTGKPKGVMTTHGNLVSNTESIIQYLNLTSEDRFLLVLPLAYCYGASWLHTLLRVGGRIYVNNAFIFTQKLIEQMVNERITGFGGVPSHYQILIRKSNFLRTDFPSLRFLAQAGGKLQTPYIRELVDTFGPEKIYIMYGQTEATARLSYLPPERLKDKMGSIGKGIPGVELKVVDKDFKPVKPGEVGELVAKGDNIMLGYWNDPEETAKVLKNGYLFTGDLATVDEDGFIYVVDRKKTMVKSGGYRVSTKEIENAIAENRNVIEVAVVGAPDELKGEIPVAFVVLKDESALEEVKQTYKEILPKYKWPDRIVVAKRLPKNESGKVLYAELKKQAANEAI